MVVAISLGAVHTHTHTHTHTHGYVLVTNHILSCSKVNKKDVIDM